MATRKRQRTTRHHKTDQREITFREFLLAAYCVHGDPIGRTWNVVLNSTGTDPIRLGPVERVLGLLRDWVLSNSYAEPSSTVNIIDALACYRENSTGIPDLDEDEMEIIEDIEEEFDHALELVAPKLWKARQMAISREIALRQRAHSKG